MMSQQGDVKLYQTNDDGEIYVVGGVVTMTPGLDNAVYLSLFGGNENDSGSDGNPLQFWGNAIADTPDERYRSETQYLLNNLPAVTANLRLIHDAVQRDLTWMLTAGVASAIDVVVTFPALNRVRIQIDIAGIQSANLTYEQNWLASI